MARVKFTDTMSRYGVLKIHTLFASIYATAQKSKRGVV